MRCSNCGALNPPEAEWCNQCLTRFTAPEPPPSPVPETPPQLEGIPAESIETPTEPPDLFDTLPTAADAAPSPPPSSMQGTGKQRGPFTVTDGGVVWACDRCESLNPLDIEVCRTCGALLRSQLEPAGTKDVPRDSRLTLLVSLAFPGAGHAYVGSWGQASARAAIAVMLLAAIVAGLTLDASGARAMSLVFVVVAVAIWAVSAHDAMREAEGRGREAILKGRMFLYLVLGILGLLMVQLFLGASTGS